MARKLAALNTQAKKLEAEKRWLALCAFWRQASRAESERDLKELYRIHAETAKAHFEADCAAKSEIIRTPTPKRCPFHHYSPSSYGRKQLRGVYPTAKRAVHDAVTYKMPIVIIGHTLDGGRHTVLIVNPYGEVTFVHPQFRVTLSESGGVV